MLYMHTEAEVWPYILPFLATSARDQLLLSIAPDAPARASLEKWLGVSGVGAGRVPLFVEDHSG